VDADYVVTGTLRRASAAAALDWTLVETRSRGVVWQACWQGGEPAMLDVHNGVASRLAIEIVDALIQRQVRIGHSAAVANLPSYSILLLAIALIHRLSDADFYRAKTLLDELADRNPRSPDAHCWLAKWSFFQVSQARTDDPMRAVSVARNQLQRALSLDPNHALSLALDGHLDAFVDRDLGAAQRKLERAFEAGPHEPLASLFLGNAYAYSGRGAEAVEAVERASTLSPLDPMRFMYDLFASTAYSVAGQPEQALHHAQRSVAQNALHLSALVQLIVSQVEAGKLEEARSSTDRYLAIRPAASVRLFAERHIAAGTPVAQRQADALLAAGMPR
jgi:adenylate cyclase